MQLYIVRHGIAIDREAPKCPADPERYLTEEGKEKTRQVATGLAALGVAVTTPLPDDERRPLCGYCRSGARLVAR